jgi:probable HAF family extracellular repeat protein
MGIWLAVSDQVSQTNPSISRKVTLHRKKIQEHLSGNGVRRMYSPWRVFTFSRRLHNLAQTPCERTLMKLDQTPMARGSLPSLPLTRLRRGALVALACLMIDALIQPVKAESLYTFTDLGLSNGDPVSINNAGPVAFSTRVGGVVHAMVFAPGMGTTDVGTLGGSNSVAYGINSQGQVTGSSTLPGDHIEHAFLFTPGIGISDLGTLSGSGDSFGRALNDFGIIVGDTSGPTANASTEFIWSAASGMVDLGAVLDSFLGGNDPSIANAINNSGQIAGRFSNGSAFVFSEASGLTLLGSGDATAINLIGQVTITSNPGNFVYTPGQGLNQVPLVPLAINDLGQIVGGGGGIAALYAANSGLVDLNSVVSGTLPGPLTGATGINDAGQIVGYWNNHGNSNAFLLTPIPEPSTLCLALFGSAALGIAARRARRN